MTYSRPQLSHGFVSPFLLPYIVADKEDLERISHTALEGPMDETIMHSPIEEREPKGRRSQRASDQIFQTMPSSPTRSPRSSTSPKRKDTSPRPTHQSVLEASISELTFDPDLTFMDSPPAYSSSEESPTKLRKQAALLDVSLPTFDTHVKQVPPDRTVIPIDASEIGFSNSLKASLQRDDTKAPAAKRPRTKRAASPPKSEPVPMISRTTRRTRLVTEQPDTATPKKQNLGKSDVSDADRQPRSTRKIPSQSTEPVQVARIKRTKDTEKLLPHKGASDSLADQIRKSPRFASKVIVGDDAPQLLSCKVCHKAYKRARDYERHIASCK